MESNVFDRVLRSASSKISRRGVGGAVAAALATVALAADSESKKKKGKKKKKPKCKPKSQATTCGGSKCGSVTNNCKQQVDCGPCEGFEFEREWGVFGSGNSQFVAPSGIAVDSEGNVYVADSSNDRIQKFDNDGTFLLKWGGNGDGDGKFKDPRGVAVNAAGEVYVADTFNNRIQKFSNTGQYLTQWNSDGTPETVFEQPAAIAIGPDSSVYVSTRVDDSDLGGLRKFTGQGTFVSRFDNTTSEHSGLAVSGGLIYGAWYFSQESFIDRISSSGEVLGQWGGDAGSGLGQFSAPHGLALDADGNLYVADWGNNRIQILTPSGAVIDTFGEHGTGNGQFILPRGVAVDGDGNVFVLDTMNERVQKFRPAGSAARSKGFGQAKRSDVLESLDGKGRSPRRRGRARRDRS